MKLTPLDYLTETGTRPTNDAAQKELEEMRLHVGSCKSAQVDP